MTAKRGWRIQVGPDLGWSRKFLKGCKMMGAEAILGMR